MIKIDENEKHVVCNSCGDHENILSIKVSQYEDRWSTTMLCKDCAIGLIVKIREKLKN